MIKIKPKSNSDEAMIETKISKGPMTETLLGDEMIMGKYPKKVKCPSCDHVNFSKAYTTNIMTHIKTKHPDISNVKCLWCEEVCSQLNMLERHVSASHEWRWAMKLNRGRRRARMNARKQRPKITTETKISRGSKAEALVKEERKIGKMYPKRVKCPSCNHMGWSKAYESTSNIMNHIKAKHPDISNVKCLWCDEVCPQFATLEHHVGAMHQWRWAMKLNRGRRRAPNAKNTEDHEDRVKSNTICVNYIEVAPRPRDTTEVLELANDPLA